MIESASLDTDVRVPGAVGRAAVSRCGICGLGTDASRPRPGGLWGGRGRSADVGLPAKCDGSVANGALLCSGNMTTPTTL